MSLTRRRFSFAQQRLWFLDQLFPATPLQRAGVVRLKGRAQRRRLRETIYESQATRSAPHYIRRSGRHPVANLAPEPNTAVIHNRPQQPRRPGTESETTRVIKKKRGDPSTCAAALSCAPPSCASSPSHHVLLITLHHIVTDGWSGHLLLHEMAPLYHAFASGLPSPLPPLPLPQYADFALWQRRWLQGATLDPPTLLLHSPTPGMPPCSNSPPTIRARARELPRAKYLRRACRLTRRLRALSQEHCATLFMTLLAASTRSHATPDQQDIVVGSPIANRNRREVEALIGFFVNTLVLRTDVSGEPSSRIVARVRACVWERTRTGLAVFEKLVEALAPGGSLSHNPLFHVSFALQNAPSDAVGERERWRG